MFDKRRCIANIYQLAKEKNLKLGDLEKKAGVSAGYLSRLNKEESTATLSADFVAAVAELLEVTVDALINNDYTAVTATEMYLLAFIDKLLSRTNADELDWKKNTVAELSAVGFDPDGDPAHPLFTYGPDGIHGAPVYNSRFDSDYVIAGDCFHLKMPGVEAPVLYLMCADLPGAADLPFGDRDYELYLVKRWEPSPLCHSLPQHSPFHSALSKLYEAVTESCKHPKLDYSVMSVIDEFMREPANLDDDQLPF